MLANPEGGHMSDYKLYELPDGRRMFVSGYSRLDVRPRSRADRARVSHDLEALAQSLGDEETPEIEIPDAEWDLPSCTVILLDHTTHKALILLLRHSAASDWLKD
jgi:hypothetical protein